MNTPSFKSSAFATSVNAPVLGCRLIITQCENIAGSLTDEQYTRRIGGKASIGEHLRHCLEHFSQLFDGLDTGIIDYEARKRNSQIEKSRITLISTTNGIIQRLNSFSLESVMQPLRVRMLFAPNTEPLEVPSTLGRELGFVASHAVHHIAIVKMLAQSLDASLPDEYGVGIATMMHRNQGKGVPRA